MILNAGITAGRWHFERHVAEQFDGGVALQLVAIGSAVFDEQRRSICQRDLGSFHRRVVVLQHRQHVRMVRTVGEHRNLHRTQCGAGTDEDRLPAERQSVRAGDLIGYMQVMVS